MDCQIQNFRLCNVSKKKKSFRAYKGGPMSILKFISEIILPLCVRVTFECKDRKLREPNCALCGGSAAIAT